MSWSRKLGILPDSPFRYRAKISHVLTEAAEHGHCFLPQPELVDLSIAKLTALAPQVIVAGSGEATSLAVKRHEVGQRCTLLQKRLKV